MTKISYENCINYIVSEKQKGIGSRAIAKALGSRSKSTVNYYYNKLVEKGLDLRQLIDYDKRDLVELHLQQFIKEKEEQL